MKVYLVGGAVRDQLLGIPIKERDWVVVGATPEQLLQKKYKQVGRNFPVFLHPITKEEYALARTERKCAPGYHGFVCNFSPGVRLEEDLARRDLTINAIALDYKGNFIDPYKGILDLNNKILRHVSAAFIEDPVRVLRVARFMARFHALGFKLANETRSLMYTMLKKGELAHLVAERVWQEWEQSLKEKNPEQFIITLRACGALQAIIPELDTLFGIPNPYLYHHEIDSGIHSLMALEVASNLSVDPRVRFSALVHDLGKGATAKHLWPSHHGHEEQGVSIIESLCLRLRIPNEYRILAVNVSRFHLTIHKVLELQASTIVSILEKNDVFRRPQRFYNLLLVCQADAQGRGKTQTYPQAQLWSFIVTECSKISPKHLIAQGYKEKEIKQALHQRRVACVELIINAWKKNEK